jgi:hypothetical protein
MARYRTIHEIRLPCYGITLRLDRLPNATESGGGSITSQLKEAFGAVIPAQGYHAAIDGLEALILAHACAGLDIESAAYLEGIETAVETIIRNCSRS